MAFGRKKTIKATKRAQAHTRQARPVYDGQLKQCPRNFCGAKNINSAKNCRICGARI